MREPEMKEAQQHDFKLKAKKFPDLRSEISLFLKAFSQESKLKVFKPRNLPLFYHTITPCFDPERRLD